MLWFREQRAFAVESFFSNGRSLVTTQRAFRARFEIPPHRLVPGRNSILSWFNLFVSAPKYGNGRLFDYDLLNGKNVKEIALPNGDDSGLDTAGWSIEVDAEDFILIGSPAVSLRGYAIASGNFLSENEICYAISTTFGDFGEGMVFIVNKDNKELLRLSGTEVGGLYGAALCKVNLYGTRSSLLVGSPAFSEKSDHYDNGAVYLYVNEGSKDLTLKRIIKGNKNGGYFGFAISSLGDLDGDEREEVAIGAPYEDDLKGAVYIYTGASLLSGNTWLQKIQPEEFQTIGHSLVPLYNCFNSGCNGISIKVDINHPDASLENKNGTFAFPIGSEILYCKNVTVLTPIEGNYDELIAYKITASLMNITNNEYSSSRAILSERSKIEIQGQVSAADCAGRERCVPILTATLQSNITEPFVVGSDNVSFSLSLLNSGETAYSACAHVLVSGAHMFRHPSTCTRLDQTEQVTCKPARPIVADDVWIVDKTTESCVLNEDETNLTAICDIGDLKHNVVKNIIVTIELHPNTIGDIIRNENADIETNLVVLLKEERLVQSLTTKLALVSTSAPAWIIILALLLGLLIICVIIYVLYKDRGNKDDCDSDSSESEAK
ncbi:unnamed protein product [Danaus chrysippus]|uniref:(African queen) hypothetical protein n=1 Tax=Danaus chrysippus TaxID=151541 RepID=A0A8J2RDW8_9NEOP|nr:unnamed protein product [Danaus chrysippus]